jgi:hypothetical protein
MKNSLCNALGVMRWLSGALLASLWLLASPALAQTNATDPYNVNPAAPVVVRPDTATVRKVSKKEKRAQAAADSAKRTERLFGLHLTRPEKAGILALLPGTGQIYNKKYWKLPIAYGMVGGLGYWVFFQQRYFGYYLAANGKTAAQILADESAIPNTEIRTEISNLSSANISNRLIFYRRQRDLSILVSILGYSLQILDAVVDAHLHDFDVSDNLSLNLQPALLPVPGQLTPGMGMSLTLHTKSKLASH